MITLQATNDLPGLSTGFSCTQPSTQARFPTPERVKEFCLCDFDCAYKERVFYDDDQSEGYRNDKTAILIDLMDESSTFEFVLHLPNGNEVILNNNDYGTFYDTEFNEKQPLKAGYLIDWHKVHEQTGINGEYYYTVNIDNYGVPSSFDSHVYILSKFDEFLADNTVKIESVNSGAILNGLDFRGMNWYRSVRLPGKINSYGLEFERVENIDRLTRKPIQVQETTIINGLIQLYPVPSSIAIPLLENDMLSNDLKISGYDLFEFKEYVQLPIIKTNIENGPDQYRTSLRSFEISFREALPRVKRNIE